MKILRAFGDDFSALLFEEQFAGKKVIDIINMVENGEKFNFISSDGYDYHCELEVREFDQIDPNFIFFVRNKVQDYDLAKSDNFYLEDQIL